MKVHLIALLMLLLLTAGCNSTGDTGGPGNTDSPPPSQSTAPSSPAQQGDTPVALTADQRDVTLYNLLCVYAGNGSLTTNWQGTPALPPTGSVLPQNVAGLQHL